MKAHPGVSRRLLLQGSSAVALSACLGRAVESSRPNPVQFVDIARKAGLAFLHANAISGEKYLIEAMGSGCGWLDYDQNGLFDLYLVNGAATRQFRPAQRLRSALYRNNGDGTFSDVTEKAGVEAEGLFGMGVAVGDYDNDGYPDLYVLGYGRSILYHNNGDGTFTDVTGPSGTGNEQRWASSAAWFDYDNDGRLDLLVVNYVDWTPETNHYCGDRGPGMRSYCHPDNYHGQAPTLYHNNGDGTFTDVSKESGLAAKPANGLGVVTFDFDNDGWQDIFISNDSQPNSLFRNNGDGTFREIAYEAGVAVSEDGVFEAGMGVDAADMSGTGYLDLIVAHLDQQLARFYRNQGDGSFADATSASKLSYETFHSSEFGLKFLDYDNDGRRDIFMAAGHVLDNIERYHKGIGWAEPKLMFRNIGNATFVNVSGQLGPDFLIPSVSRGAAVCDFDNDGDLDILVNNSGGSPQLLLNEGGNANHWLEILLIGTRSNRDGVGARVKVVAGDLALYDQRKGGMSYQSAQDPRLHFGLGNQEQVDRIEIRWPSGTVSNLSGIGCDRILAVQEGIGIVKFSFPLVSVHKE